MYHNLAAAYRAQNFFESPSPKTYTELKKAAEKAKVWPPVRERVLRYLETGMRPEAESHPLTALDIWRFIVEGLIAQVKRKGLRRGGRLSAAHIQGIPGHQATSGLAEPAPGTAEGAKGQAAVDGGD